MNIISSELTRDIQKALLLVFLLFAWPAFASDDESTTCNEIRTLVKNSLHAWESWVVKDYSFNRTSGYGICVLRVNMEILMERTYEAAVVSEVMHPDDCDLQTPGGKNNRGEGRLSTGIRSYPAELLPGVYSVSADIVNIDPDTYKISLLRD